MKANKTIAVNRSISLALMTLAIPLPGFADCAADPEKLYQSFVDYREQINTADRIENLSKYFSDNFNQYFQKKVDNARNRVSKGRHMARYWDNLNTAKDIVIIFDYSLTCDQDNSKLALISVLNSNASIEGQEVELWKVTIRYLLEHNQWKIDSFEYTKLDQGQKYLATDIKNNFVMIR